MSLQIVRRGFDIPLAGAPGEHPEETRIPSRIALLGADYPGMRPTMRVREGDSVERGGLLFEDRKMPGVRFAAPLGGRIVAVHRGARRAFLSVVIEVNPRERSGRVLPGPSPPAFRGRHPHGLSDDDVRALLLESGEWTALRARPFGRVAHPERRPAALFVTAMDTAPLAPDPVAAVRGREEDLAWGLAALSRLTDGPVFVCHRPGAWPEMRAGERVRPVAFRGPHPAGTPGLHIHRLAPATRDREAWHVELQDLASIGTTFRSGSSDPLRRIALAGPPVARPRILRTAIGARVPDLASPDLASPDLASSDLAGPDLEPAASATGAARRIISGSILAGRTADAEAEGYLGRYHRQISVLDEDRRRRFLGWLAPGADALSASRAFLGALLPRRPRRLTTGTHGSRRAIVPTAAYDRVHPFDIPAVFLLRALLMEDIERAEELGVLELIEEDLGLLTFVCPGKNDYAPALRRVLDRLEREG